MTHTLASSPVNGTTRGAGGAIGNTNVQCKGIIDHSRRRPPGDTSLDAEKNIIGSHP